jgi:hypothetical protein
MAERRLDGPRMSNQGRPPKPGVKYGQRRRSLCPLDQKGASLGSACRLSTRAVNIAGHPSENLPTGTLKNIMKPAGIEK